MAYSLEMSSHEIGQRYRMQLPSVHSGGSLELQMLYNDGKEVAAMKVAAMSHGFHLPSTHCHIGDRAHRMETQITKNALKGWERNLTER